jgi:hypothetical protein
MLPLCRLNLLVKLMNSKLHQIQQMAQECLDQLEKGNWEGLLEFENKQATIINELQGQNTNKEDSELIQSILILNQKIMAKINEQKEKTSDDLIALKRQQKTVKSYSDNFTDD